MFSEAPLTTHRTRRSAVDALHLSPGRETFQAQADVQRMRSRPFRHLDETAYRSHRQSSCSDVQQMPQLVHEGEGLLGFRILLSDHDDGAITVIQAKAQNQALFGNLPFAVVSIATEYQYTARFYRCPITIKCIVLRKPQPLAGNMGCFGRVIARQLWRFKSR